MDEQYYSKYNDKEQTLQSSVPTESWWKIQRKHFGGNTVIKPCPHGAQAGRFFSPSAVHHDRADMANNGDKG
jgi:hypothetical protein